MVKTSNQFFNSKASSQNLQLSGSERKELEAWFLAYKCFSIEIIGEKVEKYFKDLSLCWFAVFMLNPGNYIKNMISSLTAGNIAH